MPITVELSDLLADEIREWAREPREDWPMDTPYQRDLAALLLKLDELLPSAEDVLGFLNRPDREG